MKTGYEACQDMVDAITAEILALKAQQRTRGRGESLAGPVHALARSCAVLQAEIRKTGDDADKAVRNLPPTRKVELLLKMIAELSPEHRAAVRVYLDELGAGLM